MKMTKEDYQVLKEAINKIPTRTLDMIQSAAKVSHVNSIEENYRWRLFHLVNSPPEFKFMYLHDYLNDSHIDTALRRIIEG